MQGAIYLDLERDSDLRKLSDPELFFGAQGEALICLDEIQQRPELFTVLRSILDETGRPGQILLLGSASPELIRQNSETLAGRIAYLELTPFMLTELPKAATSLRTHWLRGGFPRSLLAQDDGPSLEWRLQFIRTFVERDLPQLGISTPAATTRRFWQMCAHLHGQVLNRSKLGGSLGVSHTTVSKYLDALTQTFVVRRLDAFASNLGKRLVKSPKIYIRDSGILHALLHIDSYNMLLGHPTFGHSWEGYVIENVLAKAGAHWQASHYRASSGAELDLILERGTRRIAIECKASAAPGVTRGFWTACKDLNVEHAWVVAPIEGESYPIAKNVTVIGLSELLRSTAFD